MGSGPEARPAHCRLQKLGSPGGSGFARRRIEKKRPGCVLLRELIVQDHIEQPFIHTDVSVVFEVPKLPEAVHEEADARPGGTDHLSQSLLRDRWNLRIRLARLAKIRHQQEDPGQTPFAGVEQLIDQVRLRPYAAKKHEVQEECREEVFIVQNVQHLFARDFERHACNNGRGCGSTNSRGRSEAFFAEKVIGGKQRDGGLFALFGDNSELCPA